MFTSSSFSLLWRFPPPLYWARHVWASLGKSRHASGDLNLYTIGEKPSSASAAWETEESLQHSSCDSMILSSLPQTWTRVWTNNQIYPAWPTPWARQIGLFGNSFWVSINAWVNPGMNEWGMAMVCNKIWIRHLLFCSCGWPGLNSNYFRLHLN